MPTNFVYGTLRNADVVRLTRGMVVRASGNGVVRAQADDVTHLAGLYGIVASGSVGIGNYGNVLTQAASEPVLLDTGLTPTAGEELYVSAVTAGKATNVAPGNTDPIGIIVDASSYTRNSTVRALINPRRQDAPHAQLVWQSTVGTYLPTDNLDARSCYWVGAQDDAGALRTGGATVRLPFTAAGGMPLIGATVYMASSQDDGNTGRGKATATQPTLVMPAYPLFTQNIVQVGVCTNNDDYALTHVCTVRLGTTPGAPVQTVPSNQTTSTQRVTGLLGGVSSFHHDGSLPESSWQNGESIWIAFTVDQVTTTAHEDPLSNIGSGTGWSIFVDSAVSIVNQGVSLVGLGPPRPGLNILAATRTGGNFRGSLNGGAVFTMADPGTTPGATPFLSVDYTRGGLTGIVFMSRVLTDPELSVFSAWNVLMRNDTVAPSTNFFVPPPTLITDPNCRWYLDLTTYISGAPVSVAGPGGSGFTWTLQGPNLTRTAFTYVWNRNPQSLYLDGPLPSYDSKYLSRDRQLQRIAFTAPTLFDLSLMIWGFSLDDTDNGDEGALAILINGSPLAAIGAAEDGVTRYSPFWSLDNFVDPMSAAVVLSAPYHVEVIMADKLTRIDTFDSGGALGSFVYSSAVTFDTAAISKRLVVLGDGETYGGHSSDLPIGAVGGGAVVQRVRADYPGRVSGFGVQATQSILKVQAWGNGSMLPYADFVALNAHEGTPATVVYLLAFGFMDWFENTPLSVAAFAIAYGAFLDRLHAQDGSASFAIAKPVQTAIYANLNANGESLLQFANAVGALQAARVWLTLVDLTAPNAIAFTGSPLAINPSQPAGASALKENIKAAPVVGY